MNCTPFYLTAISTSKIMSIQEIELDVGLLVMVTIFTKIVRKHSKIMPQKYMIGQHITRSAITIAPAKQRAFCDVPGINSGFEFAFIANSKTHPLILMVSKRYNNAQSNANKFITEGNWWQLENSGRSCTLKAKPVWNFTTRETDATQRCFI